MSYDINDAAPRSVEAAQAQPAPFTHTPRPAVADASGPYAYQRRFGRSKWEAHRGVLCAGDHYSAASVFRSAADGVAELRVEVGFLPSGGSAELRMQLGAAGLRELARCLIDAAHDLDTLPATAKAAQ